MPENYVLIDRLPCGVDIYHPYTETVLYIRVPMTANVKGLRNDAESRFAYDVDPEGKIGDAEHPLIKIVKTPDVKVTVAPKATSWDGPILDLQKLQSPFMVFEVDSINSISPDGYDIVPQMGWRKNVALDRMPDIRIDLTYAFFDTAISMIPSAGLLINIIEFEYAAATGLGINLERLTERWVERR
jgi:hypothetical protein